MTDNNQTGAGTRFRQALVEEAPLQVVGTINANHALLAKRAGYRVITLSGGGVELYESIGYHEYEAKLDALFAQNRG
ncbi:hypothetical protein A9Y76_05385 [Ralstonia insidiosa]|uniref:Methylisocitrate lyase n=1 Tax=Ralstonia insidiosa TaxID=190721 RepID=A0A191ZV22_9RALS|nr:hypothetical protein [Ralstonia insidiosa]ANJ71932.1 hypothetical protein A9Y76_05385 [Ralstonia insidiosa]